MEERNGQPTAAPWHRIAVPVTYGTLAVALVAAPFAVHFFSEARPVFRPVAVVEKPGAAALAARLEPGAGEHVETPAFVKGIYVTSSTASSKRRFAELVDLVDRTELNAMVIDIKNARGDLAFAPKEQSLREFAERRPALGDLTEFTRPLKEKGIYLIARQFVFQDPAYVARRPDLAVRRKGGGIWSDRKGVTWLDAAAKDAWKYNVDVAKEAYAGGFDEIQLDYVRFPTDGSLGVMEFPFYDSARSKTDVMAEFFRYMHHELRIEAGIPLSVDLFGLTMIQHDFDLGIGQRLSDAAPHFDYISPMVYPSHYPSGYGGFTNPAAHPYDVVYGNMEKGVAYLDDLGEQSDLPLGSVRPWIQDFDLGANYDAAKVRAQMDAAEKGGATGWLLWNARNVYTEGALARE